jgi:hypothetical protein
MRGVWLALCGPGQARMHLLPACACGALWQVVLLILSCLSVLAGLHIEGIMRVHLEIRVPSVKVCIGGTCQAGGLQPSPGYAHTLSKEGEEVHQLDPILHAAQFIAYLVKKLQDIQQQHSVNVQGSRSKYITSPPGSADVQAL